MSVDARRRVGVLVGLVGAGASALTYARYRRDIRRARERIAGGRIVETSRGPIEYASAGSGPPILVIHGAGGGFDQAMFLAQPLVRSGFRVIAMSRFGYLGTPLPPDASAAAQADAHAALLDALDVPRAAVLGASAGAPSAMQFALRHPDRTSALVLLVPVAYPSRIGRRSEDAMPGDEPSKSGLFFDLALKSDFLFWLMPRVARGTACRAILATPPEVVERASAEEKARIWGVLERILPVSRRRLGLRNDAAVVSSLPRYELEKIAAPTLVISAEDDLFGIYEGARYSAERIPGARFVGFPTGGHLWVGRHGRVMAETASFLRGFA
jgi:pimeloyl-ACP methyl ester carboxylesterase